MRIGVAWSLLLAACASADPPSSTAIDASGPGDGGVDATACASRPGYEPVEMTCDELDNDCDGTVDNVAAPPRWYPDADGDGHGSTTNARGACVRPAGYLASNDDCDDSSPYVKPGAEELCDGLDNDCSMATSEACTLGCVARQRTDGDRHRYLFCAVVSTWEIAERTCINNGFRLARVDDATENAWLRTTINDAIGIGTDSFWIGGNDKQSEDVWRWNDNVQFWQGRNNGTSVGGLYRNWQGSEPNNDGDEDCGEITSNGQWNDNKCGATRAFACERF